MGFVGEALIADGSLICLTTLCFRVEGEAETTSVAVALGRATSCVLCWREEISIKLRT